MAVSMIYNFRKVVEGLSVDQKHRFLIVVTTSVVVVELLVQRQKPGIVCQDTIDVGIVGSDTKGGRSTHRMSGHHNFSRIQLHKLRKA